ncbi:MAG: hypothetical protein ACUZ9M_00550 [Candidatus Scalindua sp.]
MAKETSRIPEKSESKEIKELLRLARAKCPHLFDKGKVEEDEMSIYFPSVKFICKICGGYIRIEPDTEKFSIEYKEL